MPVNKATKELLRKEIDKVKALADEQEKIVASLQSKYDQSFKAYNEANDKLLMLKDYLKQYKEDIREDINDNRTK